MPHPVREDLQPLIEIPNTDKDQAAASQAINTNTHSAKVYLRQKVVDSPYIHTFTKNLNLAIKFALSADANFNVGVVFYMIMQIEEANARPERDKYGQQLSISRETWVNKQWITVQHDLVRLIRVGCRATLPQKDIATACGCSVSTVSRAIKTMKECEIILTTGRGALNACGDSLGNSGAWYEFNPLLVWYGDLALRKHYLTQYMKSHNRPEWCDDLMEMSQGMLTGVTYESHIEPLKIVNSRVDLAPIQKQEAASK